MCSAKHHLLCYVFVASIPLTLQAHTYHPPSATSILVGSGGCIFPKRLMRLEVQVLSLTLLFKKSDPTSKWPLLLLNWESAMAPPAHLETCSCSAVGFSIATCQYTGIIDHRTLKIMQGATESNPSINQCEINEPSKRKKNGILLLATWWSTGQLQKPLRQKTEQV